MVWTLSKNLSLLVNRDHIHVVKRLIYNKWHKKIMVGQNLPPHRSDPVITTLDSPEFKSIFTPELQVITDMFKRHSYELRVAGGAVRDMLMGKTPKDLDFATTATPTQMKEMFTKEQIRLINVNGEKHGTITSRINDKENFEITTLRVDVTTDGRHAEVIFTTDWLLDANRRDLTINSMFLDFDGRVYDYFYGYDDLMKRKVRFVGDPQERIQEDFLRIFRYFRFYGRIAENSENHDEDTIKAIKDNVEGLERISGERIWSEWSKILEGNFHLELTKKLLDCGCGKYMGLPANCNLEEFDRVCSRAEENNVKLRAALLFSALLNSPEDLLNLFKRQRFPNFDRDLALFVIANRDDDLLGDRPLKPYQSYLLKYTGKLSDARAIIVEFLRYKGALQLAAEFETWESNFPISGRDVQPYVFDNPKLIGRVILRLKDIWIENDFGMSTERLKDHIPGLLEEVRARDSELKVLRAKKSKEQKEQHRKAKAEREKSAT